MRSVVFYSGPCREMAGAVTDNDAFELIVMSCANAARSAVGSESRRASGTSGIGELHTLAGTPQGQSIRPPFQRMSNTPWSFWRLGSDPEGAPLATSITEDADKAADGDAGGDADVAGAMAGI